MHTDRHGSKFVQHGRIHLQGPVNQNFSCATPRYFCLQSLEIYHFSVMISSCFGSIAQQGVAERSQSVTCSHLYTSACALSSILSYT